MLLEALAAEDLGADDLLRIPEGRLGAIAEDPSQRFDQCGVSLLVHFGGRHPSRHAAGEPLRKIQEKKILGADPTPDGRGGGCAVAPLRPCCINAD